MMLGWDRTGKVSPSPEQAPFYPLRKHREEMGKGQVVLALDLHSTSPLSLAVVPWREAEGNPGPRGSGRAGGMWWEGRGSGEGRGREASPSEELF